MGARIRLETSSLVQQESDRTDMESCAWCHKEVATPTHLLGGASFRDVPR
jgi:hypothetical protein